MRKASDELVFANLVGLLFLPLMAHFAWLGTGVLGLAMAMVYLIALRWGSFLPYLAQFGVAADDNAGMRTSLLYFANILGSAAGAIITGFILTDYLTLVQVAQALVVAGTLCALCLIAMLDVARPERLRRSAAALGVLAVAMIGIPLMSHRLLENLLFKRHVDHAFASVVENRSGIITVEPDGTVFGNGMYDGQFNTRLNDDRNGIIRPYALSLFHGAPRDVLMIGLSSGSWAQVIASNPAVASLTIVEINPGYRTLIAQQPEVDRCCATRKSTSLPTMADAGSAITPTSALTRSYRIRPGIFAPTSPTCCRSSFCNLRGNISIRTASCSIIPPIPRACSEPLAWRFPTGRVSPTTWSFRKLRSTGILYAGAELSKS